MKKLAITLTGILLPVLSFAQIYTDFSGVIYKDEKLYLISNIPENSTRFFSAGQVYKDELVSNEIFWLPEELISIDIPINVNCSEKSDLESFDNIENEFYFLQERCAKLLFPNERHLDYLHVSFGDYEVTDYKKNKRLEGLSILRNNQNDIYQIAISVEAGIKNPDKPPFLIVQELPDVALSQTELDGLAEPYTVKFPVEEIYRQYDIKPYGDEGCYMRVPEIEWSGPETLFSLVSFNPSACYKFSFLCEHSLDVADKYKIKSTKCFPLTNFMSQEMAQRNWEGMDKISANKFILIADEKKSDFRDTFCFGLTD